MMPVGACLQTGVPGSLRAYTLALGAEKYRAWGDVLHSVHTGQPAFEHVFGMGTFAYYAQHPEAAAVFNQAMTEWTTHAAQAMQQFDQAFQTAAALGVTVCCAAGDNGSGDGASDGRAHVDFPASSPFTLACGGTKLTASGTTITSEVVWNEGADSSTGGGVSSTFPLPSYQSTAHVPPSANPGGGVGRGVPDVAGDADPATGYQVRVDGQTFVIGGTSAVAPLWAGLIALMNQHLRHSVGFLNPLLYGSLVGKGVFHDITSGNNGAYTARAGWDACTGWGTPDGTRLLNALGG